MRNLSDIIKEVLVHQHATKDMAANARYPYGKEIEIDDMKNISDILNKTLKEDDKICVYWYTNRNANRKNTLIQYLCVVDKDNKYPLYTAEYATRTIYSTSIKCKYMCDVNKGRFEDWEYNSTIDIEENCKIRYCTAEECTKLDEYKK